MNNNNVDYETLQLFAEFDQAINELNCLDFQANSEISFIDDDDQPCTHKQYVYTEIALNNRFSKQTRCY